jgi:hypothetical protein
MRVIRRVFIFTDGVTLGAALVHSTGEAGFFSRHLSDNGADLRSEKRREGGAWWKGHERVSP